MQRMYCEVQPRTDSTRVNIENQTCSKGTLECNRVQIRHVYILKIKVVPVDALSILHVSSESVRGMRVSMWS